ncbi:MULTISPECIES: GtrA family protein [unclassified Streptomyces]|jgi:putative flippase GtrA|uniref:GtrA family protein n=1 Tax=unclassified Streptomyces TaxID=2593676 RepID=UPI000D3DA532|nr:GtrA family protein [Streptomyces sp. VMFN-G11Ma]PTM97836.1 putative flippase GtrA [Streptomyces sp. VMFN-G11Ma]
MEQGSSGLRRLVHEIAKFGAVGALGTVVNFGVSNMLWHLTSLQAVRANVIATVVAICVNYVGFRYFTYRDRDKSARTKELTLFLAFSAVGLVIENGVLYAAIYGFGWDSSLQRNIFKVVGIGLGTLFRFWSYRSWVFRALPTREPLADAEALLEEAEVQTEVRAEVQAEVQTVVAQPKPKQQVG